jgi:1-aminocyclopropane-1-carboxylate deaminase/D-cysteine desulfhydrase-like pyridoxal-dependent ACC family enzyme
MAEFPVPRSWARERLATLPTPLEPGGRLPGAGGARLFVKRDDLTGLGMGGNKARKLEFLCGQAKAAGADLLVTVGAAQSNHARLTAAAGARLGLETHLVLGGPPPAAPAGNQLLAALFGAVMHYPGTDDWDALEAHMGDRIAAWETADRRPYGMPVGGSTPAGARGFLLAWAELLDQCAALGVEPAVVVIATSSGGTHAGMLAGRALLGGPAVLAIAVAKTRADLAAHALDLAARTLVEGGMDGSVEAGDVHVDDSFQGPAYAVPTVEADEAVRFAARRGWVLDRVYTAKAFAGLLAYARQGRLPPGDVVFWHTGGQPALFAPGGAPSPSPSNTDPADDAKDLHVA